MSAHPRWGFSLSLSEPACSLLPLARGLDLVQAGSCPRGSRPGSAGSWAEAASAFSPLRGARWSPPSSRSQPLAGATCFGPTSPTGQPLSPCAAPPALQMRVLSDLHVVSSTHASYTFSVCLSSVTGGSRTCAWHGAFGGQTNNSVFTDASGRVSHGSQNYRPGQRCPSDG